MDVVPGAGASPGALMWCWCRVMVRVNGASAWCWCMVPYGRGAWCWSWCLEELCAGAWGLMNVVLVLVLCHVVPCAGTWCLMNVVPCVDAWCH